MPPAPRYSNFRFDSRHLEIWRRSMSTDVVLLIFQLGDVENRSLVIGTSFLTKPIAKILLLLVSMAAILKSGIGRRQSVRKFI